MTGMAGAAAAGADAAAYGGADIPPDAASRSPVERGWDNLNDFLESDAVGYVVDGVPVIGAALAAPTAAAAAVAGGTALAAVLAARASSWVGGKIGEAAGHAFMGTVGSWLGYEKMVADDEGEMPAVVGHKIAHVSMWATLGALALGAVAGVVVGALIIGSAGTLTPLVVVGAAAAGGLIAGLGAGFASAAGQYGKNKGEIMTGSHNVFFRDKGVARRDDIVKCDNHGPDKNIAQGAKTVFANNLPIARIGHRTTCDGKINEGIETIAIDKETNPVQRDIDAGWAQRIVRSGIFLLDFLPGPEGNKPDADGPNATPNPDGVTPDTPNPQDADTAPTPSPVDPTPNSPDSGSPNTNSPDGNSPDGNSPDGNRPRSPDSDPTPPKSPDSDGTPPRTPDPDPTPPKTPDADPTPPKTPDADPTPPKTPDADPTPPKTPDADPTPPKTPDADPTPPKTPDPDSTPPKTPDPNQTNPVQTPPTKPDTPPAPKPETPKPETPKPKPDESAQTNGKPDDATNKDGDPIDVASGQVAELRVDINLPGTIPLILRRAYSPGREGVQGRNWAGTWAQHLRIDGEGITYQNEEGVLIEFHAPREEVHARNIRFPHLTLSGTRSGMLYIFDRRSQMFTIFEQHLRGRVLLTRLQDRNANHIRFVYDEKGLKEVRHSDGYSLSVESRDMVIRRAILNAPDSVDCGFVWTYNDRNVLCEVISSQTGTLRYTYDQHERMTSWADTHATRAHYEYGADGRVSRNWSDTGHLNTRFEYDLPAQRTVVIDALGGVTTYDWDKRGLVWRQIDQLGNEWLTEWGRNFNVVSRTDPLGNVTRYEYDIYGDRVALVDPLGNTEKWTYYVSGRVRSHTARDGATTVLRYDNRGNLASVQDAEGNFTRYRRAESGQVLRIEYPGGGQERFQYDLLKRPRIMRTIAGFEQHMQYDGEGRLVRLSDQIGAETRWDYTRGPDNLRGAMRSVTLPDGGTTFAAYDTEGMRIAVTNAEGGTRRSSYGAFDLLETSTDEAGHSLQFEYNALTRLTAVINQQGERYEIAYDACGRITAERDYSGLLTRFEYDAAGRLARAILPDGCQRLYTRNAAGQMVEVQYIKGKTVARTRFAYDAMGRRLRAETADSLIEYTYDAMGRTISEIVNGRVIRSEYDEHGLGRIARSGDVLPLEASYGLNGQMSALRIAGHDHLNFAYDPRGFETMRSTDAGFALTQGYNATGQLIEQIAGALDTLPEEVRYGALTGDPSNAHLARAGILCHRSYVWDRAHRAVAVNDRIAGEKTFDYDERGQVTGVMHKDARGQGAEVSRFGYDPNQNLTEVAVGMAAQKVTQQAGRVRQRGHVLYEYDNAGRVIEKRVEEPGFRPQVWRMGWDARGHMVRLETPKGEVWRYDYDALGRRIRRLRLIDGGATADGAAYQWEGSRIIAEAPLDPEGAPEWDRAAHWVYEPRSFRPLARAERGELHYVVNDHIGTPRELFTEDGAAVAWRQDLSLWGEPEPAMRKYAANDDSAPQDGPDLCPIRFAGQWHDDESGLHYNNHRYYDPESTQYISPDPIGLLGGIRPQAYVANPNGWVDPLGLAGCKAYVDEDGVLNLKNRFRDPEDPWYDEARADEFEAFVDLWNEEAQARPEGFTRQEMTPELTNAADNFRARARRWLDARGMTDLAPGHLPDTGWGGAADPGDAWVPLDRRVNRYIGGLTQGVDPGTTYYGVRWF